MKFPRNAKIFRGQLEAAPFAGVFFLLVIFMLLNSNLVFRPGILIQLPEDSERPSPGIAGPVAVIVMDLNGRLYYESQMIQETDLTTRLKTEAGLHPDLTLVIQADKAVSLGSWQRVARLANQAGVKKVLLASRPETTGKKQP